jgi:hypothetical protein
MLARGDADRLRLAVLAGAAPGPVRWNTDGPWVYVDLCGPCSRTVADVLATSPVHRRGAEPIEAAAIEAALAGVEAGRGRELVMPAAAG